MDAFYVCFVVVASLRRGVIPFLSDVDAALTTMGDWGGGLEVLIWMGVFVQLSVVASGILLYQGRTSGVYLAAAQMPFRILFVVPSVSVILLLPGISTWLWLSLLVASEGVKGWSLWWLWRSRNA